MSDHEDNFWDELPRTMALAGLNPTKAGFIRQDLKKWVLLAFLDIERELSTEAAQIATRIIRDRISGHPKGGKS